MSEPTVLKNEDGMVLVVTLTILALLTLLGLGATTTATIELDIATNDKAHKITFYAADAGIETGRAVLNELKAADKANWDNLLQGNQILDQEDGITTIDEVVDDNGGRSVGPATFTLAVRDNDDLDGNDQVDTDNVVILIATGSYGDSQSRVEAHVRYTGESEEYAQEHYDSANSGGAAGDEAAVVKTRIW